MITSRWLFNLKLTIGVLFILLTASAKAINDSPKIAPINTLPGGQTYGRWAAEWWQWALGIPAAKNPVSDNTGEFCDQRQVDKVWFLAGAFSTSPIVRSCTIPEGKSLFFPLINNVYIGFLDDPIEKRTDSYARSQVDCSKSEPALISVWIDGKKVNNPTQYYTGASGSLSPIFNIQLPPNNFVGTEANIPELALSPSAEVGYYLFVEKLKPGNHQIRWVATWECNNFTQDITYNLKVLGNNH